MTIKVFVGNLKEGCSKDVIEKLFTPYGKLHEVSVLGAFGFVHFDKQEDADRAVKELNQKKLDGKNIIVEISKRQGAPMRGRPGRGGPSRGGPSRGGPSGSGRGRPTGSNSNFPDRQSNNDDESYLSERRGSLRRENSRDFYPQQHSSIGDRRPSIPIQREFPERRKDESRDLSKGYIIHEHYYIERSHPIFDGLYFSDFPHLKDSQNSLSNRNREDNSLYYRESERPVNRSADYHGDRYNSSRPIYRDDDQRGSVDALPASHRDDRRPPYSERSPDRSYGYGLQGRENYRPSRDNPETAIQSYRDLTKRDRSPLRMDTREETRKESRPLHPEAVW